MSKKQTKNTVRTYTTGVFEADMLGHMINVCEETRDKQNTSQRPHRKDMKESKQRGGLRAALDRYGERSHTALDTYIRRGKALKRLIKKKCFILGKALRKD